MSQDVVDAALDCGVPAVNRAIAVLSTVAASTRPVTLSEVAVTLGIAKSTAHGLCHTLARNGYLRREQAGFVIGAGVMTLAHAFVRGTSIAAEFGRMWADMPTAPADTIVVALLSGSSVMYAAAREGARPLGLDFREGMQLPAHATASGKAILAWRSPVEVRDLLERTQPSKRAFVPVEEILDDLAVVRRRGWSIEEEGVRQGVVSFGAPVFDREGHVVAGLALCVHKTFAPDHAACASRVLALAADLTRRIGGTAPMQRAA